MLFQLVLGAILVSATVAIHGVFMGTYLWRIRRVGWPAVHTLGSVNAVLAKLAVWSVFAHVAEILLWAVFHTGAGAMPDLETAGNFSAVTYATIGYGDVTPPAEWRLLASMECLVGILMCAWSGRVHLRGREPSPCDRARRFVMARWRAQSARTARMAHLDLRQPERTTGRYNCHG